MIHSLYFFFFNDTATTEIYTLSLHDALPIWFVLDTDDGGVVVTGTAGAAAHVVFTSPRSDLDRKSTRLNSSHRTISYAVFCLKKKKKKINADSFRMQNNYNNII